MQIDPLYQEACREYVRHNYTHTLALLGALGKMPSYQHDHGAQRYLFTQTQICRRALGLQELPNENVPRTASVQSAPRLSDCGPRALLLVCNNAGIPADLATLRRQAGTTPSGTTLLGLAAAAKLNGWKASGVQMDPQALSQLSRPAIAWVDANHYVAVLSVHNGIATIQDPNISHPETVPISQLWSRCAGVLLTLQRS